MTDATQNIDHVVERLVQIQSHLNSIEQDHDVRVLMAVEAGSRAWNFPSLTSDFDVRFVYVHRRNWYLDINSESKRDVIEVSDKGHDLDISGWDLRKALTLFAKGNAAMYEWLASPITYRFFSNGSVNIGSRTFCDRLKELVPFYHSTRKISLHYLHMAKNNWRDSFHGDDVKLKKYLYVLRPVLSVLWLEQNPRQFLVPQDIDELLPLIAPDARLSEAVHGLLALKRASVEEMGVGRKIPIIDTFLISQIARFDSKEWKKDEGKDMTPLNELFREFLPPE